MSKEKQPRLFEAEKVLRNRKPFNRVRRSTKDIAPFVRFLKTYRMIADNNNGKVKIKELQDKFRIGHFARSAMPDDILTIDEALINEPYAEEWRRTRLTSYYNDCDRHSRVDEVAEAQPVEVKEIPAQKSLADILADIEQLAQSYIASALKEIQKAKTLL